MIVYNLLCDNAHRFEGWFTSPEAFAHQHDGGQLSCPVCGSSRVSRQLSAPYVQTGPRQDGREDAVMANPEMLAQIRKQVVQYILQHTEDVGERFPEEARAIFAMKHPSAPSAARPRGANELREEGIEVFTAGPPVPPEQLH
jgi:hypothetical protein